jgi:hypothetical protein
MPREITGPLRIARDLVMGGDAWIMLVEIPRRAGGLFRLAGAANHVRAGGVAWQACSLAIELPAEELGGSLGSISIEMPNVSRIPLAYVELDDASGRGELVGAVVTCWLWSPAMGPDAALPKGLSWSHRVLSAVADRQTVKLECGHPAATERVPKGVMSRDLFPALQGVGL